MVILLLFFLLVVFSLVVAIVSIAPNPDNYFNEEL